MYAEVCPRVIYKKYVCESCAVCMQCKQKFVFSGGKFTHKVEIQIKINEHQEHVQNSDGSSSIGFVVMGSWRCFHHEDN